MDLLGEAGANLHHNHHHHAQHDSHLDSAALSGDNATPAGRLQQWLGRGESTVQQVDLIPTVSMLLGLPVPHGSVGGVIPGLLWNEATANKLHSMAREGIHMKHKPPLGQACRSCDSMRRRAHAAEVDRLRMNAFQVRRFLMQYGEAVPSFHAFAELE